MSRLIVATKSFADPKTAPKRWVGEYLGYPVGRVLLTGLRRYEDTVVIFGQ